MSSLVSYQNLPGTLGMQQQTDAVGNVKALASKQTKCTLGMVCEGVFCFQQTNEEDDSPITNFWKLWTRQIG